MNTDGAVRWEVTTTDNVTHTYGRTAANQIADPKDATRVFSWLLEESKDDRGNFVLYEYKAEDGKGVEPTKISERSRFERQIPSGRHGVFFVFPRETIALHTERRPTDPRVTHDFPTSTVPHPNDLQALIRYKELYTYDHAGNILSMAHSTAGTATSNWTRTYSYDPANNRLLDNNEFDAANDPSTVTYQYNAHGPMKVMSHLPVIDWDYGDRMQHANRGAGGGNVYFTCDGAGQRVRKVWEKAGSTIDERIYISGWETFRQRTGSITAAVTFERQTLHVADDQRRIAMVETKIVGGPPIGPRWRFQLTNLLGSSVMELDAVGHVISYEEYHPYGSTAFQSSGTEVSAKRYRYTGKEKDEETGLYYHRARYYVPWLGRWTAPDPAGFADGPNLYAYSRNNPVRLTDRSGLQSRRNCRCPFGGAGGGPGDRNRGGASWSYSSGVGTLCRRRDRRNNRQLPVRRRRARSRARTLRSLFRLT